MMEAKELRVGNLVYSITHNVNINVSLIEIDMNYSTIEGIPLTEEWLVKLGFEETYNSQFRLKFDHKEFYEFGYDFSKVEDKSMEGFRYYGRYIKIKYVHQLQNLYFALTGEELG